MPNAKILVVEDEPAISEVLQYNLEKAGFAVRLVERGEDLLGAVRAEVPDLILLDLMLPGIDGLELTRQLKRGKRTAAIPLIMLTARDSEVDRIVGLELGADDYITKPFSPREVVLRVQAVLRRARPAPESRDVLSAGGIRLEADSHRVTAGGRPVELTAIEFRLLETLLSRAGRVQSRGSLLSDVWGYADGTDSRTVDTHIRRLRSKLGEEGRRIETVVGVGYRLEPGG